MKRYGYGGDPDANGEFYLVRDVGALEDEVADARRDLARMREELAGSEASRVAMHDAAQKAKSKHFGFVDPMEAQGYLKGRVGEITVSRSRELGRVMRVDFPMAPKHYKHPDGRLPGIGWDIYRGKDKCVVVEHKVGGELVVEFADGLIEQTKNWSLNK